MKRKGIDWESVHTRLLDGERALEEALTVSPARIEAIYHERAVRLGKTQSDKSVSDGLRVLVFRLAGELYAIELKEVAEVLRFAHCTPVPGGAPQFPGVISVRGELRTVLDLARLLGMSKNSGGDSGFVLMLGREGRQIGLKVDSVERVGEVQAGEVCRTALGSYTKGIAPDTLILLDVDAVVADVFSPEPR